MATTEPDTFLSKLAMSVVGELGYELQDNQPTTDESGYFDGTISSEDSHVMIAMYLYLDGTTVLVRVYGRAAGKTSFTRGIRDVHWQRSNNSKSETQIDLADPSSTEVLKEFIEQATAMILARPVPVGEPDQ